MSEVPGAGRLRAARHDEGMTTLPLSPDELLTTTRTVRKRLDLERPVPMELVRECLEVALQAPSGSNRQGWQWVVVTDAGKRAEIGEYYRRSFSAYAQGGDPPPASTRTIPSAPRCSAASGTARPTSASAWLTCPYW